MARIYGILKFFSDTGNVLFERQYKFGGERARLIDELSKRENVSYYQIQPFAQYWHKNFPIERKNVPPRPKPIYTNIPTYQYK